MIINDWYWYLLSLYIFNLTYFAIIGQLKNLFHLFSFLISFDYYYKQIGGAIVPYVRNLPSGDN